MIQHMTKVVKFIMIDQTIQVMSNYKYDNIYVLFREGK